MEDLKKEDLPLCPTCNRPIFAEESSVVVVVDGMQALIHYTCTQGHKNRMGDCLKK